MGRGGGGLGRVDFRAYLRCGILAHGFARIRCDDCAAERLVAFSCKGRGVCPSCNARRMVEDPDMSEPREDSPGAPGDEAAAHSHEDSAASLTGDAARSRWARLLARIYEVFPLRCPDCGSDMRILAFLIDPEPTGAILRCLDLPHTVPRLSPARAPPQAALELHTDPVAPVDPLPTDDFDQTPAFDPADPEPVPELDLDQTRGA